MKPGRVSASPPGEGGGATSSPPPPVAEQAAARAGAFGWADAAAAADILALDPAALGGARLRARPGPARDAWLVRLAEGLAEGAPVRRIPAAITEERLLGGLDLAATLAAGRPVTRRGLLAEADGGVAVLAMAERAGAALAAHLGAALDDGAVRLERDGASGPLPARIGVVALDEGDGSDEAPPAALSERLAFTLALDGMRPDAPLPADHRARIAAARARLPGVACPDGLIEALCAAADALGVASPRAAIFALRVARAAAALDGRSAVDAADAALAARLALGPRATQAPAPPPEEEPDAPDDQPSEDAPPDDLRESRQDSTDETLDAPDADDAPSLDALTELVIAAARASLPAGVLAGLAAAQPSGRAPGAGSAGAMRKAATRGRPLGARPGAPRGGARLDLVETLRAAAPWQPLRRREAEAEGRDAAPLGRVLVRREDFRIRRFKRPAETLTLFVVDASGSAAAQRLAEAKGAVELMLAESYVRRDRVALVTFRGTGAALALAPTRALARAKRALAGLPGGGGTPLAAGLDLAAVEAEAALRRGWTPTLAILTDGRANVRRDGEGGREAARAEALEAAARLRALGLGAALIDSGARPSPEAAALAKALGARYLPLPRADAAAMAQALAQPAAPTRA